MFDRYVEVLGESYPFFVRKHLDWAGLARSYRSAVPQTETPADFYRLVRSIVSRERQTADWRQLSRRGRCSVTVGEIAGEYQQVLQLRE